MKKILLAILLTLICGASFSLGITTYENIRVDGILADFASRGVEVNRKDKYIYYEVPNENASDEYSAFSNNAMDMLGQPGDIILALGSNFPDIPPLHFFIDHYFGFHAALVMGNDLIGEAVITSVGGPSDIIFNALWPREEPFPEDVFGRTGVVKNKGNYFIKANYTSSDYYNGFYSYGIVGLRIKGITDDERKRVVEIAEEIIESQQIYNYLFFINNKKGYYCTSFIEDAFNRLKPENREDVYNVNYDGFTSGINDMILSKDVYIYSYFRVNEDGIGEVYYLEGEKTWNQ